MATSGSTPAAERAGGERRVTIGGRAAGAGPLTGPPPCWGSWRPALTLGAESRGGLLLPAAHPSARTLYAPRGVWLDGERLVVADSGNHRVLVWHTVPDGSGAPADVVLGQPDAECEGPAAGGLGVAVGMHLPTGVLVDDGRLLVADAWHHRLLVWDTIPDRDATPPDHVIGQPTPDDAEPNHGGGPTAASFYWPFGIAMIDGRLYVADTGNRRVLVWTDGIPLDGRPADIIIGQSHAHARDENRGGEPAADSFRWPHGFAATGGGGVYVADAGNHRILRFDIAPDGDRPADGVIGQPDFASASEFPYVSQEGRLRFPYGICGGDGGLAVTDTANNRVLVWDRPPRGVRTGAQTVDEPPDAVLAQPDAAAAGENRWEAVGPDTLCWPYGIARHGDRLAVADSGNNRVCLWRR